MQPTKNTPRSGRSEAVASDYNSRSSSNDRQERLPLAGVDNEEVARRAYARWEESDRSHGRDQEHWFAAENELRQQRAAPEPGPDDEDLRESDEARE